MVNVIAVDDGGVGPGGSVGVGLVAHVDACRGHHGSRM